MFTNLIHSVRISIVLIVPRCNAHALNYLGIQWVFSGLCTKHKHMWLFRKAVCATSRTMYYTAYACSRNNILEVLCSLTYIIRMCVNLCDVTSSYKDLGISVLVSHDNYYYV